MDSLLTTREACEYLKVHRRTLYRMLSDGRLPFRRIEGSRRIRVSRADVEALLVPGKPRPDSD